MQKIDITYDKCMYVRVCMRARARRCVCVHTYIKTEIIAVADTNNLILYLIIRLNVRVFIHTAQIYSYLRKKMHISNKYIYRISITL